MPPFYFQVKGYKMKSFLLNSDSQITFFGAKHKTITKAKITESGQTYASFCVQSKNENNAETYISTIGTTDDASNILGSSEIKQNINQDIGNIFFENCPIVVKDVYVLPDGAIIDAYKDDNHGLVIIRVPDDGHERLYLGKDVTNLRKYSEEELYNKPYKMWKSHTPTSIVRINE